MPALTPDDAAKRIAALTTLAAKGVNLKDAAAELGLNETTLGRWLTHQGRADLRNKLTTPLNARNREARLTHMADQGLTLAQAAAELDMRPKTLREWLRRHHRDLLNRLNDNDDDFRPRTVINWDLVKKMADQKATIRATAEAIGVSDGVLAYQLDRTGRRDWFPRGRGSVQVERYVHGKTAQRLEDLQWLCDSGERLTWAAERIEMSERRCRELLLQHDPDLLERFDQREVRVMREGRLLARSA